MPHQDRQSEIPIELTNQQITLIEELAELEGQSFQDTLDDVVNEVLEIELPKLIGGV